MTDDDDSFMEPVPGYWRALGKFLHQFARLERTLHFTLHHFAGVNYPMAQAMFSGLRADACISAINRILDAAENDHAIERLKGPLDQAGLINSARNNIIHWGAFPTAADELISINDFLAHSPEKLRSIPVTCEILDDLQSDTLKIMTHLLAETSEWIAGQTYEQMMKEILERAWRYRLPPQPPHLPSILAHLRERKLRRGASRRSRRKAAPAKKPS